MTTRASWLPLAGLLAFSGLLVVLHVRAYTVLSPVDELQHADYLIKASHGELVRRGDPVGLTALREAACRGIAAPIEAAPDCKTSTVVPEWLRDQGTNSEELQPPTYYFVTGGAARLIRPVIGSSSLLTAGRVAGAAWLMGGVLVLWAVLALLDVPVLARVVVTLLVVSTPVVLHASSTINNDTTALVAGGGVLLAALAWEKGRVPWFVVPIVAAVAISLKVTNVIGVGAVVVYLLVRVLSSETPELGSVSGDNPRKLTPVRQRPSRQALAAMAVGITAAVGVVGLSWVAWHDALARAGPLANPNIARFQTGSLALSQVLGQLDAGVTPIRDVAHVVFLDITVLTAAVVVLNWLLLGTAVGAAALGGRASRTEALGIGALVAMVATGPLFVISNYVSLSMFASIPGRYALSAVPVLAVVLALSLQKRWVLAAVGALAVVAAGTTFVAVATA